MSGDSHGTEKPRDECNAAEIRRYCDEIDAAIKQEYATRDGIVIRRARADRELMERRLGAYVYARERAK